jgi:superfamily II DNA or RNA helicase
MFDASTNVTLVAGDVGRDARLAIWPTADGVATVDLVLPTEGGDGVDVVPTRALLVPLGEALDELVQVGLDSARTRSVRALAEVARVAIGLVADGRLHPAVDGTVDAWTLSPLTSHERSVRAALADWLPPEAHCLHVPSGDGAPRIRGAGEIVADLWGAVADLMPRTAAAALVSGQRAWAVDSTVDVSALSRWLPSTADADRAIVGLRVVMPAQSAESFRIELQVRSSQQASLVADAAALWAGTATGFGPDAEADVLVALRRGAAIWPALTRLLESSAPVELELEDDEAMALFGPLALELASAGIEVLVPTALTRTLEVRGIVEPPPGAGDGPGRFDLATACQLTWRAEVDGEPLDDAELSELAATQRPLVQLRGRWVVVDPRVAAQLSRRDEVSGADSLAAALSGTVTVEGELYPVEAVGSVSDFAQRLRAAASPHEADEPAGLHAVLRPYQRRGVAWMSEMAWLDLGGVLADDMGLGKTIQLIALHLRRIERGEAGAPTLVVCPASVVGNWEREMARFAPGITVHRYHGPDRDLGAVGTDDLVVTTYGIARRDRDVLAARSWGIVVADEAQQIKNPNTAVARAMRRIPAAARFALTGTPVENRLTELWSLLDWTIPGLLGHVDDFRRRIAIPIERDRDGEATERFARIISPFVLRRRKDDPEVAPDLPPKTETDHTVTLTKEQAGLYRATVEEVMESIAKAEGIARRGLVLKLLTALKQICNHPSQYLHEAGPLPSRSGKLEAFDDLVTAIADAGDATLVFTQYVVMGELLIERLGQLGLGAEFLHGGLPLRRREEMVDRFQEGGFPVFVISLKAGGTGLNLTRATHVVHYDRWWNPAVENQASDRAWRIGQDRPVQIHRLISEGTLEERIAQVLEEKSALADAVVGAGEAWITELDDVELAELVGLGSREVAS